MNRHFIYSALPVEVLGTPIRQEPTKGSPETPWKPLSGHPDYLERINPQGIREVSHKDHVPAPVVGLTQAESEARGDSTVAVLASSEVIYCGRGVTSLWAKKGGPSGLLVSIDKGATWGSGLPFLGSVDTHLGTYYKPLEPQS